LLVFFFQPFKSRLLAPGVSSSAFQQHTSYAWRFFLSLPTAGFLRRAFLSAFQQQTSYAWRFFLSLPTADFLRLAFLSAFQEPTSCAWRFFPRLRRPTAWLKPRGGCGDVPARADLFARVSPPPAGGKAASVLKRCWAASAMAGAVTARVELCPTARAEP